MATSGGAFRRAIQRGRHRQAVPASRAASTTLQASGASPASFGRGAASSMPAVTTAQPERNDSVTTSDRWNDCTRRSPGSMRQRTSAPEITPKPTVCAMAMALAPACMAAGVAMPVPLIRCTTAS